MLFIVSRMSCQLAAALGDRNKRRTTTDSTHITVEVPNSILFRRDLLRFFSL